MHKVLSQQCFPCGSRIQSLLRSTDGVNMTLLLRFSETNCLGTDIKHAVPSPQKYSSKHREWSTGRWVIITEECTDAGISVVEHVVFGSDAEIMAGECECYIR